MLRAARVKFVTVTMFILLGIFIIMGAATYGLIHNRIVMSADATFGEIIIKVKPGSLEGVEVPRAAVLRISASGQENIIFDSACFTEESVMELYDQAVAAGEDRGQIGNVYFSIVEKYESTIFIAADRTIEKNFEDQSVTFTVLVLAGAYLALFFIVWGFSYLVMKPVQNAFIQQNRFISDASHELKTPLAIIQNYSMALKGDLDRATREKYADALVSASRRLTVLVSDILKLNKLENQEIRTEKKVFRLDESIAESVLRFEDRIEQKKLSLSCDLDEISVCSDPNYLEIVWNNLISNAVKFTEENGRISVSLKRENGRAVVKVSDTGCGISPENLNRIFEPFFSTKQNIVGSGTGLGLAMVYGIVRQTEGFIKVESKLGKGTTFFIYLPRFEQKNEITSLNKLNYQPKVTAADGSPVMTVTEQTGKILPINQKFIFGLNVAAIDKEPENGDIHKGIRILFVEDEDSVRSFALRALKKKGYEVIGCNSAENALEQLSQEQNFQLLVTDMVMPGMNGLELARRVREIIPNIKIILASGYSEEITRSEIDTTINFTFMAKPFSLGDLTKKIFDVLNQGDKQI